MGKQVLTLSTTVFGWFTPFSMAGLFKVYSLCDCSCVMVNTQFFGGHKLIFNLTIVILDFFLVLKCYNNITCVFTSSWRLVLYKIKLIVIFNQKELCLPCSQRMNSPNDRSTGIMYLLLFSIYCFRVWWLLM